MRTVVLIIAAACLIWPASPVGAERRPEGDITLVDETFRMAPGADAGDCIDVPEMAQLTIVVSSAMGRTGESALFHFGDNRQTARPNVLIALAEIPSEDVVSTHLAPAGSYCYYLAVTHNLTSTLPDDAPEKPYKYVRLKIVSSPYLG